ncbi:hypothetical protein [Streptomyces sp. NPDC097610]|uniref:hypothetical protein n=1 Tax=Streptomyces sp. NPDC097610 TaxID=3157227 RepID=UPI00331B42B0
MTSLRVRTRARTEARVGVRACLLGAPPGDVGARGARGAYAVDPHGAPPSRSAATGLPRAVPGAPVGQLIGRGSKGRVGGFTELSGL